MAGALDSGYRWGEETMVTHRALDRLSVMLLQSKKARGRASIERRDNVLLAAKAKLCANQKGDRQAVVDL